MVKVEIEIDENRLADVLCCAFEGGSNYWYFIKNSNKKAGEYYHEVPFRSGGYVLITDLEDDDIRVRLNKTLIKKGIQIMAKKYPEHLNDILMENEDGNTGDAFLQCCVFGDIIYG